MGILANIVLIVSGLFCIRSLVGFGEPCKRELHKSIEKKAQNNE